MSNPSKNHEFNDDRVDQSSNGEEFDDASSICSGVESSSIPLDRSSSDEDGLTERLRDIFVANGDGDLLLQQSDRDNRVFQWLQALDLQVIGACRADERSKSLLKTNVPNGMVEDRLLEYLIQHFKPSEIGLLVRCFCVPLLSIRVGKISMQGKLLCPTPTRGNLNLTLLPTYDLRLSFLGDDGHVDRLFTLSGKSQSSAIEVEEIPADSSGRSFLLRMLDGPLFYFWCSEKSKLLGIELLAKMKGLLKKRPSVGDLTGISESRLDCFATHLNAYLVGSAVCNAQATSLGSSLNPNDANVNAQSIPSTTKSLRLKGNISLSPRSSSFKERLRRRADCHFPAVEDLAAFLPVVDNASGSTKIEENGKVWLSQDSHNLTSLESLVGLPGLSSVPPSPSPSSSLSSLASPYYCWCPANASLSIETPLPSLLLSSPSFVDQTDMIPPSLDFPAFLPIPSSRQILTFTPLMCESIVHIPVIASVCSSGQGYHLVSAGPTTIGSAESNSLMEKGARETLRLLLLSQSSQGKKSNNNELMEMYPVNQHMLVRDVDAMSNSMCFVSLGGDGGEEVDELPKASTCSGEGGDHSGETRD